MRAWMAGFEILVVLGLLGLLALSSMACLPRSDDDLPLVDTGARLDALLALASPVWSRCSESRTIPGWERARTATTKSMTRSWQTCSCPRRRPPRLEASIPRRIFLLLGRCGGLSLPRALPRNLLSCLRAGRPAVHLRILRLRCTGDFVFCLDNEVDPVERTTCAVGCTRSDTS